jgi:hypothetical protein
MKRQKKKTNNVGSGLLKSVHVGPNFVFLS